MEMLEKEFRNGDLIQSNTRQHQKQARSKSTVCFQFPQAFVLDHAKPILRGFDLTCITFMPESSEGINESNYLALIN